MPYVVGKLGVRHSFGDRDEPKKKASKPKPKPKPNPPSKSELKAMDKADLQRTAKKLKLTPGTDTKAGLVEVILAFYAES